MHDADEPWLADAVRRGSEPAWRALYERAARSVERYVRWRCGGCHDLADEALGETWLVAVRRIGSFDPGRGPFAAWVGGIAAKVVAGLVRRRKPTVPLPDVAAAVTPERDGERVAHALAALSDRHEAVLRAKYLDGRSVLDIAAAWGESPKAVESLLTRAREAFRAAYEQGESS